MPRLFEGDHVADGRDTLDVRLERRIDADLACGRHMDVIPELRRIVAVTGEGASWITLGTTIRFPVEGGKPARERSGRPGGCRGKARQTTADAPTAASVMCRRSAIGFSFGLRRHDRVVLREVVDHRAHGRKLSALVRRQQGRRHATGRPCRQHRHQSPLLDGLRRDRLRQADRDARRPAPQRPDDGRSDRAAGGAG